MLKKLLKRKPQGFTLIEIVLVLAIAGLILIIVFLAVAGAQRSRRDTGRKDYVNRAAAEYDQLVADGTTPPQSAAGAATLDTATGQRPDRVTAVISYGACTVAATATTNATMDSATPGNICILLEDGSLYQKNANQ